MPDMEVAVVMGSKNDYPLLQGGIQLLKDFGIGTEVKVLSAHRTPSESAEYFQTARERGIRVIICAAGGAAHLAGVAAAHTTLPVIGIPLDSSPLQGLDALMSTVQMPAGIPVATVSVGKWGAKNAALLAIAIIANVRTDLHSKLEQYRQEMKTTILNTSIDP